MGAITIWHLHLPQINTEQVNQRRPQKARRVISNVIVLNMKLKGKVQMLFSILSFLISCYGFLWILSSASLASEYCGSNFSLFHSEFRCIPGLVSGIKHFEQYFTIFHLITDVFNIILFSEFDKK